MAPRLPNAAGLCKARCAQSHYAQECRAQVGEKQGALPSCVTEVVFSPTPKQPTHPMGSASRSAATRSLKDPCHADGPWVQDLHAHTAHLHVFRISLASPIKHLIRAECSTYQYRCAPCFQIRTADEIPKTMRELNDDVRGHRFVGWLKISRALLTRRPDVRSRSCPRLLGTREQSAARKSYAGRKDTKQHPIPSCCWRPTHAAAITSV